MLWPRFDLIPPGPSSYRAIIIYCNVEGGGGDLLALLSTSHPPGSSYDGQKVMGLAAGHPPRSPAAVHSRLGSPLVHSWLQQDLVVADQLPASFSLHPPSTDSPIKPCPLHSSFPRQERERGVYRVGFLRKDHLSFWSRSRCIS